MTDFEERKRAAIVKKHVEAMDVMLRAQGMPYPACIAFFAQATIILGQAAAIMQEKEDEHGQDKCR